jgi:hypothetical protein
LSGVGQYGGVALLGSPGAGSEELAKLLTSAGFYPLDQTTTVLFEQTLRRGEWTLGFSTCPWPDAIARLVGGHFWSDVTGDGDEAGLKERLSIAFTDGRECALGAPLLVCDPLLVPFAGYWLSELAQDFLPVVIIRDPAKIVADLNASGIPRHVAFALWERIMSLSCRATQEKQVSVVDVDTLMGSEGALRAWTADVVGRLDAVPKTHVDLDLLDAGSRELHTNGPFDREDIWSYASPHQARMWQFLSELPTAIGVVDWPDEFRDCSPLCAEILRTAAWYEDLELQLVRAKESESSNQGLAASLRERDHELEVCRTQVREMSLTIDVIHDSPTWRVGRAMLAPVRVVRAIRRRQSSS